MALKYVYREFSTPVDYEHEYWPLIADMSLEIRGKIGKDYYAVTNFKEKWIKYNVANYKISISRQQKKNEMKF